ncbi:ATP-grasp domain-containing protein [Helcococcus kunzii]|uniref:ATP-grasp domain-containing protein n=1 Tax=Helcococcus kunzii TaxID=40091 RepID=UPI0024AE2D05|nr:ATP-grasp domain-containing protein [Helcococcus kunzii]
MKKVLIFGVAPVQMDAIIELKKQGYEVHAIAQKRDGVGADYADFFEEINFMDTDKTIEYIKKHNIDVVYSVGSDLAMPQASKISEMLDMPRFVSEETARICNNKTIMRQTLGNDFEGNVKFQVVDSLEKKPTLVYPFIVKPADSQGQRGITIVNNEDEYKEAFELALSYSRSGLVINEAYIRGTEISVNCYMLDGKMVFMESSDRDTWDEYFGLIHKHELPAKVLTENSENKLREILENACKKVGINNGPMYAQVKVENDTPYIIEITPRLDGCHMWNILTKYTGVNLLKLVFNHLLNGDTSELDNYNRKKEDYTLEFICQEPNTAAKYGDYKEELEKFESFCYYKEGDNIRPVNNQYEKIGYFIYKGDKQVI